MNTVPVLDAVKGVLSASFPRTYIYPTDYDLTPVAPTLPFIVIEEMTGSENRTDYQAGNCTWDRWDVSVTVFASEGVHVYPSKKDAKGQKLCIAHRDTVESLLKGDKNLGGTVVQVRDGQNFIRHGISPLQWNKRPYMGVSFTIPVWTE